MCVIDLEISFSLENMHEELHFMHATFIIFLKQKLFSLRYSADQNLSIPIKNQTLAKISKMCTKLNNKYIIIF